MKNTTKWLFIIIGAAAVIAIIWFAASGNSDENAYEGQPYLGEEDAPVTVLEFGDYKCPYCKAFEAQFFPQIDKELIQTGEIKFYFINLPFINVDSKRAAKFAETVYQELGNETYWKFHSLLYEKQPADPAAEKQDIYDEEFLKKTLGEMTSSEDVKQVMDAFNDGTGDEAVEEDLKLANKLNVSQTPTLIVDGERFEGQNIEDLKKMVEEAK
ncbi:DsbA family protein [Halobacillus salinarum]|uniref:DsbA family protein n=1 Tax=Halobacillus salinarum TaxID=2932257 RepID=A0ABY4ENE4_9BACI|nr:thioredoxin domain-containing protein [Halobacillus salinarum]UOQ45982.1 DsbA family protein [Halobacillus salinarum]